ncbi:flagellar basal body-associated protein FliL [Aliivibrio kagoshimensis]|uniref:flagellar basal body-associated protein FliL n=1 Tax=Aliivibrio kagoshimensis TaxID=2910230 RepID=UPI003D0DF083
MADDGTEKKRSPILFIIIGIVLVAGIGAGAWFFFLSGGDTPTDDAAVVEVDESQNEALYVNVSQPFIFNVTGDHKNRLVQIKVQLMVRGNDNDALAQLHTPLVESSILSSFGAATLEQLRSPTGRLEIRAQALSDLQAAFDKIVGKPVVEKVLFTDFVMQ